MATTATICFDVQGSVQQEIDILEEGITPEDIVEKLNAGKYLTTLEICNSDIGVTKRTIVYFDEEGNEVDVAEILSQTVSDEIQYSRFQLDPGLD